ncbi:MAG: serine/threonine-protein kinase [bacterium]|nr:serine/threonine-protein kinase [Candidatus Sumerlaeota bacterium]
MDEKGAQDAGLHEPEELPADPGSSYHPPLTEEALRETTQLGLFPQQLPFISVSVTPIEAVIAADGTRSRATPDTFKLREMAGRGGFGEVWEAEQISLNRTVAVKRIRASIYEQNDPDKIRSFEQTFKIEAITTGQLDHPNIIPVHDLGADENGRPLMAMKLAQGTPWDVLLAADLLMPMHERLAKHLPVLIKTAQAAGFAHSRGIIHRDIKPAQVMMGSYGEVLLMDWGLAVAYEAPPDTQVPCTEFPSGITSAIPSSLAPNPAGTVAYMAPEQTESTGKNLGPWTDIFQLGGLLYHILTDTSPHKGDTAMAVYYNAARTGVEPPELRDPSRDIPLELSRICMKALTRDRHARYQSAQEFIDDIEAYMSGAGRRNESCALAAQADQLMVKSAASYEILSQCEALLSRALNLWPDNTQASELRHRVRMRFVKSAISEGDLNLAEFIANGLREGEEQTGLLARIGHEKRRKRRNAILLRLAVAVCVLFVVVSTALYFLSNLLMKRAQNDENLLRWQAATGAQLLSQTIRELQQGAPMLGASDPATSATRLSWALQAIYGPNEKETANLCQKIAGMMMNEGRDTEAGALQKAADNIRIRAGTGKK